MARSQVLGLPRMISLDLTLTEEEARALMGMMQNPLADIPPDEEPEVDKSVRHAIFDPLHAHFYGVRRPHVPEGPYYENPRSSEKSGDDLFPNGMRARE